MAYYNGFPATYPQYIPQPVMPYQQTAQMIPQPQQMQPTQMSGANQPQTFTPPTIRAEIIQVDDEKAAAAFPVGAGSSQMMITKDESAIFIKSATANGQTTLDVYDKRPPAPPAPTFNPGEYVRKDELEVLISAALASQAGNAQTKRTAKREGEE